jgi:hypothetical protein
VPTGWELYTSQNDRLIKVKRPASLPGTQGSPTGTWYDHSHDMSVTDNGPDTYGSVWSVRDNATEIYAKITNNHTWSGGNMGFIATGDVYPPYIKARCIRKL